MRVALDSSGTGTDPFPELSKLAAEVETRIKRAPIPSYVALIAFSSLQSLILVVETHWQWLHYRCLS